VFIISLLQPVEVCITFFNLTALLLNMMEKDSCTQHLVSLMHEGSVGLPFHTIKGNMVRRSELELDVADNLAHNH